MKVIILTEGGSDIGFGHITRSTALYHLFKKSGNKVEYIIKGDECVAEFMKGKKYQLLDWQQQREQVYKMIEEDDVVIIDSYNADDEFYSKIAELASVGVYINGNKRLNYPEGIVVKGSLYAKKIKYPKKPGTIYLLGPDYVMLRKAFWEVERKEINKKIKNFFIAFGGEDIKNKTPEIMELLNTHYTHIKKNIIIGKGFRNIREIENIKDKNTNLIFSATASKMKKLMQDSDVAISSGGQTLYELARVGVPTIAVCCAENQKANIESWQKIGFIECWVHYNDPNFKDRILEAINTMKSHSERKKRSNIGSKAVDGRGAEKVFKKIIHMRRNNE